MNAAFLLVTSAWLAGGQQAAPPAQPAPPAKIAPAPMAAPTASYGSCGSCGSCGASCGCNECEKPGFLDRLKARFRRDDCGCAAPAPCQTCAPVVIHKAAPCQTCAPACNTCEQPSILERLRARHETCGSCGSTCDSCDRPSILDRLKARFHRDEDCGCTPSCGTPACSSCGAAPAAPVAVPAKPGDMGKPPETIKKLPMGDTPPPAPKEISAPKTLDLTPTSGNGGIIESGTKNPF